MDALRNRMYSVLGLMRTPCTLRQVRILTDKTTKKSRGMAFVEFKRVLTPPFLQSSPVVFSRILSTRARKEETRLISSGRNVIPRFPEWSSWEPRQVRSQNFKRNVSRLKVFRGKNEAFLRSARAPIPNTFGMFLG
jgi:hypothetical protein